MIRLDIPREPYWMDLPHGVRAFVRPLSTAVYEAARGRGVRKAREILTEYTDVKSVGGSIEGLPDLSDEDAAAGLSQLVFAQCLARFAIIEWEGVQDSDGAPQPVTPEAVDAFMMIHSMAEAFVIKYTRTHERLVSEGNASRPSPNGTSAEGRNTAKRAARRTSRAPTEG